MNRISISTYGNNLRAVSTYIAAVFLICATVVHVFLVNNGLPFLTQDELTFLTSDFSTNLGVASSSGRISVLFGYLTTKALSFNNPTTLALLPRFFSIIILYSALTLYLRYVCKSWLYSIGFASIIIAGHIIDCQHNGMVAFFGGYNVYLGAYLLAIVFTNRENKRFYYLYSISAFLLLLLSFASEFFFGLAALHLTLYVIKDRGLKERSYPFLAATAIYVAAFILLKFVVRISSPITSAGMADYLYGNVNGPYSIADIAKGWLLYVFYSLPVSASYASLKAIDGAKTFLYFSCFAALSVVLRAGASKLKLNSNFITIEFILLSAMLIFVPNFLITLQPLKLKWILTGASNRYVFSYYAWIGYVFAAALILYYLSRYSKVFALIFVIAISPIIVNSMELSRHFVDEYSDSMVKWRQLNALLSAHEHGDVVINSKLLTHPNITVIPNGYIPTYAKKFYDASVKIISDAPDLGMEFSDFTPYPPCIKKVSGVSGPEAPGRWTDGPVAEFVFSKTLPSAFTLAVDIVGAFGPNEGKPVLVEVGDWRGQFVASPGHIELSVKIDKPTDTLKLVIPKPTSPLQLGISDDPRLVGIMLKRIALLPAD